MKIKCFIITFKLTATELDTRHIIIGNVKISVPDEDAPNWGEMRLKFKQKNRTLGKPMKVNLKNILQFFCIYERNEQFAATLLRRLYRI